MIEVTTTELIIYSGVFILVIYTIYRIALFVAFKKISRFYNISFTGFPKNTKYTFGESIDYTILRVKAKQIKTQDNIIIDLIESQEDGIVPAITSKDVIDRVELDLVDSVGNLYLFKTIDDDAKFLKNGDEVYGLFCGNKLYAIATDKNMLARKIGEKVANKVANGIVKQVIRDSNFLFSNHEAN